MCVCVCVLQNNINISYYRTDKYNWVRGNNSNTMSHVRTYILNILNRYTFRDYKALYRA